MGILCIVLGLLILFGVVGLMAQGRSRFLPDQSRRHLGILLCIAWMVFLAVHFLAAAILAGHPGGNYRAALEQLGLWPPILAWGSLGAGIFLLSSRTVRAPVPKTEGAQESVEG